MNSTQLKISVAIRKQNYIRALGLADVSLTDNRMLSVRNPRSTMSVGQFATAKDACDALGVA